VPFPRKQLNEGEDIVLDLHPHWWFFAKPVTAVIVTVVAAIALRGAASAVVLVLIALILISVAWLGVRYAVWSTTNFTLTTDRLIYRAGVIRKHGREIPLERINDISCSQSMFERILGAGDVVTESGGERGQQMFTDLPKPFLVQNAIYREIERAQARDADRMAGNRQLSIPEQIEKLDELRKRGVLTGAEFEAKKKQLLDRL
jgi:uncharacterized membrane protein YdbT with pleckstrin-like domain